MPITHDLLRDVVDAFGPSLERVVITELREATYFAELQLKPRGGARCPCRAAYGSVALAVRTAARCSWSTSSWTPKGSCFRPTTRTKTASAPDEFVGKFREFLDSFGPRTSAPDRGPSRPRRLGRATILLAPGPGPGSNRTAACTSHGVGHPTTSSTLATTTSAPTSTVHLVDFDQLHHHGRRRPPHARCRYRAGHAPRV